jgi:bifunctional non-homologous end joining protein LigD
MVSSASKVFVPKQETHIEVQGRRLTISRLDKVMYPESGFTKGQLIDYYVRIAPVLLPHLRSRPLTLKRYPDGVTGFYFYEKNCPSHRPEWVSTAHIWSGGNDKWMDYCMAQDLPTLIWVVNLADIEMHTSLSLAHDMPHPSSIVFDLDPGAPADIVQCCQVAVWVRDIFNALGLKSFAKTSGSKGMQVYVPLNSDATYGETKPFAHELARLLQRQYPELVVSDMKKSLRVGKVLVDWSQNDDYKTTICVYSLRAMERPTVSTPVSWEEIEDCLRKKDALLLVFEHDKVLARVAEMGDLFLPVLNLRQKLPAVSELLALGPPIPAKKTGTRRTAAVGERTAAADAEKAKQPAKPAQSKSSRRA